MDVIMVIVLAISFFLNKLLAEWCEKQINKQ